MRTLFIDDEPEASDTVEQPTAADLQRRRWLLRLIGVYFIGMALFLQWWAPATTLRCEAPASGAASCVVSDHMLLGLVETGTATLSGVRGARMVPRPIPSKRYLDRYHVVLQMAGGPQRDMTSSSGFYAADQLARTIDERLRAGAAFEASIGFTVWDWERPFLLVMIANGAWMAVLGQLGYRRSRATQP